MKVAVIGSRSLDERAYKLLSESIPSNTSLIVSGGAAGVDSMAERYAQNNGIPTQIIPPDYPLFGHRAPLVRNTKIVEVSDFVLVLWDGHSRGTANVIMSCIRKNKPFRVLLMQNCS